MKFILNKIKLILYILKYNSLFNKVISVMGIGDWGLGFWGVGVGGRAQNPQNKTPTTNPQKFF